MYRRHSTIQSAKSIASPHATGLPSAGYMQNSAGISPSAYSAISSKPPLDTDALNPDDLFARYTVSEVKAIQQRLRNDAEIKQEELRLMVGERYRDLIQASSSIISMAASSQKVLGALDEARAAILAQEEPPLPHRTTVLGGVDDRRLHALQLLSAHMKVLLDAPEHLWRLIERKRYLSAAWLFLFTRVVHRALVQQDDQDEDSWSKLGVDVLSEFPLVQRQWDEISSFRSQIIHKATLSLREIGASPHEICATLVTLHLLDSRPLSETFAALLAQRSKALSSLISWRIEYKLPLQANGHAGYEPQPEAAVLRRHLTKEILQANQKVLDTILNTVFTSRRIFEAKDSRKGSLVNFMLQSIQSDTSSNGDFELPNELKLSTHSLLINSSSSAHFLLLPTNLQSYRPYIDLSSASMAYSQTTFNQALQDWLRKSSKSWQSASDTWLINLVNVKEIWELRSSTLKWIQDSELDPAEKFDLAKLLDESCHSRILSVWKATLSSAQDAFKVEMVAFLSALKKKAAAKLLFEAPPPPFFSQGAKVSDPLPFQQYQTSLKQQLLGRTAQLDAVLSKLEQCARAIQKDMSVVLGDASPEGKAFGKVLVEAYRPEAESTSNAVATVLEEAADHALREEESGSFIGITHLSDELGSSSPFIAHIGCRGTVIQKFKSRVDSVLDRIVQRWRQNMIDRILESLSQASRHAVPTKEDGPSPILFQSLLSLSEALRELGLGQNHIRHQPVVRATLRLFIDKYTTNEWGEPLDQHIKNIAFLKAIADTYGSEWQSVAASLSGILQDLVKDSKDLATIQGVTSEFLARTQTLLTLLLPCSSRIGAPSGDSAANAYFLLFGNLSSSQKEYKDALELAESSPRFGLLLVGAVASP